MYVPSPLTVGRMATSSANSQTSSPAASAGIAVLLKPAGSSINASGSCQVRRAIGIPRVYYSLKVAGQRVAELKDEVAVR
jgi:hypothetical protein